MTKLVADEVVLSADEIDRLPAEPLSSSMASVTKTSVFDARGTYAGVLRIPAGVTLPAHEHHRMGHHVLVVAGSAGVFGRTMPAGSYWFVPAGHRHTVEGIAPDGCTLFYVDVPAE